MIKHQSQFEGCFIVTEKLVVALECDCMKQESFEEKCVGRVVGRPKESEEERQKRYDGECDSLSTSNLNI